MERIITPIIIVFSYMFSEYSCLNFNRIDFMFIWNVHIYVRFVYRNDISRNSGVNFSYE